LLEPPESRLNALYCGRNVNDWRNAADWIPGLTALKFDRAMLMVWVEVDFRLKPILSKPPESASLYGGAQLFANLRWDAPTHDQRSLTQDALNVWTELCGVAIGHLANSSAWMLWGDNAQCISTAQVQNALECEIFGDYTYCKRGAKSGRDWSRQGARQEIPAPRQRPLATSANLGRRAISTM
jgi:hypothetical protein